MSKQSSHGSHVFCAGRIVDRYELLEPLGRGAMGEVWRARQVVTDAECALKILHRDLGGDERIAKMFLQEARIGARLASHPGIAGVQYAGTDETSGLPFLVMELLLGETLDEHRVRTGALGWKEFADLLPQLSAAVELAHAEGVVHRDLKPGNLFLVGDGEERRLKVLDFGVARILEENVGRTATQVGTPAYAAPEQLGKAFRQLAAGQGVTIPAQISPSTDTWALGILAFELLTDSEPAHFWDAVNVADLMLHIALHEAPIPSKRAEHPERLPAGFDDWFAHCVVRDSAQRHKTFGEAVQLLRSLLLDSAQPKLCNKAAAESPEVSAEPGSRAQPTADTRPSAEFEEANPERDKAKTDSATKKRHEGAVTAPWSPQAANVKRSETTNTVASQTTPSAEHRGESESNESESNESEETGPMPPEPEESQAGLSLAPVPNRALTDTNGADSWEEKTEVTPFEDPLSSDEEAELRDSEPAAVTDRPKSSGKESPRLDSDLSAARTLRISDAPSPSADSATARSGNRRATVWLLAAALSMASVGGWWLLDRSSAKHPPIQASPDDSAEGALRTAESSSSAVAAPPLSAPSTAIVDSEQPDESARLVLHLEPGPGAQGAAILISNTKGERRIVDTLPASIKLPTEGNWTVQANRPGYEPFTAAIERGAARELHLQIALKALPDSVAATTPQGSPARTRPRASQTRQGTQTSNAAVISVNSIPRSTIFLDGKPLGQTPLVGAVVPNGKHTITFALGNTFFDQQVQLTPRSVRVFSHHFNRAAKQPAAGAMTPQAFPAKKSIDLPAARRSLRQTAANLDSCARPEGPFGKARVRVTFGPSGSAIRVRVERPFLGTKVGTCIASRFRRIKLAPFDGEKSVQLFEHFSLTKR